MKLIRDFRLLENLTEMEAGLEAPKYHASDVADKAKREKLLRRRFLGPTHFVPQI